MVVLYDLPLSTPHSHPTLYRRSSFSLIRLKNRWTLMGKRTHSSNASRYSSEASCCSAYASSLMLSVLGAFAGDEWMRLPAKAFWMRSRICWAEDWLPGMMPWSWLLPCAVEFCWVGALEVVDGAWNAGGDSFCSGTAALVVLAAAPLGFCCEDDGGVGYC